MARPAVRGTSLLFMVCAVSFCGCSSWPDFDALAAEGEANNAPIIIFGEHWVPPDDDRHDLKIGFVNLQDTDISAIRLFVAQCRVKGSMHIFLGHILLNGPFKSRQAFIAKGSWVAIPSQFFGVSGVYGITVITRIEIDQTDGRKIAYSDDGVRPLIDKRISNFCPVFTGY